MNVRLSRPLEPGIAEVDDLASRSSVIRPRASIGPAGATRPSLFGAVKLKRIRAFITVSAPLGGIWARPETPITAVISAASASPLRTSISVPTSESPCIGRSPSSAAEADFGIRQRSPTRLGSAGSAAASAGMTTTRALMLYSVSVSPRSFVRDITSGFALAKIFSQTVRPSSGFTAEGLKPGGAGLTRSVS